MFVLLCIIVVMLPSEANKDIQCESKKTPLRFSDIFPNGWEFLNNFSHTYYTFLSTLDYKFLFNYLQL